MRIPTVAEVSHGISSVRPFEAVGLLLPDRGSFVIFDSAAPRRRPHRSLDDVFVAARDCGRLSDDGIAAELVSHLKSRFAAEDI